MNNFQINNKLEARKLLEIAAESGRQLLRSGSEIYRIENSIHDICMSHENITSVEVFSMTTAIFISMKYEEEIYSELVRVKTPSINLRIGELISNFVYDFCHNDMEYEEAMKELKKIHGFQQNYPLAFRALGAGVTSAFFSILFGGNTNDFISAFLLALWYFFILGLPKRLKLNFFVDDFIAALLSSLLAFLSIKIGFGNNIDMIIIGTIMPYVPGISITVGVRDAMMGDYVSGLMEIFKAVLKALAIAIGVGITLSIYLKG